MLTPRYFATSTTLSVSFHEGCIGTQSYVSDFWLLVELGISLDETPFATYVPRQLVGRGPIAVPVCHHLTK